jgi:hypothetical protein
MQVQKYNTPKLNYKDDRTVAVGFLITQMPKYIPTEGSGSITKKKIDVVTEHQKYQLVVKLAPVRMLDANLIQE